MSSPQPPPEFPPRQFGAAPPGPVGPATGPQPVGPATGGQPLGPTTGPQPVVPPSATGRSAETSSTPYGFDDKGRVQRTKVSGVWIGLIAAAVVLILLIVFIAQNLDTVSLHFLGFSGTVSFGLALLVAAIAGVLIAAVPGTVRILQLRKALRRNADLGSGGSENRP